MINQAATLGFTPDVEYKNIRTETFWHYWTGQADLFDDHFLGESGYYFYEEIPDPKRKTGIVGRGLEGFVDAALKAFGI